MSADTPSPPPPETPPPHTETPDETPPDDEMTAAADDFQRDGADDGPSQDARVEQGAGEQDARVEQQAGEQDARVEQQAGEQDARVEQQAGEQDARVEQQAGEQDARVEQQAGEQDARVEQQAGEQDARVEQQAGEQDARVEQQAGEQDARVEQQAGEQDARVEQQAGEQDARVEQQAGEQDARVEQQAGEQDARVEQQAGEQDARVEEQAAGDAEVVNDLSSLKIGGGHRAASVGAENREPIVDLETTEHAEPIQSEENLASREVDEAAEDLQNDGDYGIGNPRVNQEAGSPVDHRADYEETAAASAADSRKMQGSDLRPTPHEGVTLHESEQTRSVRADQEPVSANVKSDAGTTTEDASEPSLGNGGKSKASDSVANTSGRNGQLALDPGPPIERLYPNALEKERNYPAGYGFLGHEHEANALQVGDKLERRGPPNGEFASPVATSIADRALRPDSEFPSVVGHAPPDTHRWEVLKPLPENVRQGVVASYYRAADGGGMQYLFPGGIDRWESAGYLRRIDQDVQSS